MGILILGNLGILSAENVLVEYVVRDTVCPGMGRDGREAVISHRGARGGEKGREALGRGISLYWSGPCPSKAGRWMDGAALVNAVVVEYFGL
jgi:hypothetical protein